MQLLRLLEPAQHGLAFSAVKHGSFHLLCRTTPPEVVLGDVQGLGNAKVANAMTVLDVLYSVCNSRDWLACLSVEQLAIYQTESAGPCSPSCHLQEVICW